MRGLHLFVATLVSSAGLFGCQDSYSSDPDRNTYMGDVHAAENPWVAEAVVDAATALSAPMPLTVPTAMDTPDAGASADAGGRSGGARIRSPLVSPGLGEDGGHERKPRPRPPIATP
jgi:hypothetical protein